jgi:DNA repair exonuclease SbcCD nuclease subunit
LGKGKVTQYPRILHTSDLHLSEDKPETVDALDKILETAKIKKVDLVTIAGDLFDTVEDAEALRPTLRSKLSNLDFKIIAIPGNHDLESYQGNLNFGSSIMLATEKPYKTIEEKNTKVVAVPFVNKPSETLLNQLREESKSAESSVLLLHCTLDIGCNICDFGEEETYYFPISMGVIESLGYDHVLAGHFHRTPQLRKMQDRGYFIYPGSPVSISRSEVGQRSVILIDDWMNPVSINLDTFYFDYAEFYISPGEEEQVVNEIYDWYSSRIEDNCKMSITVNGYTILDENRLEEKIKQASKNAEHEIRFRDVSQVVKHPLYLGFMEKLQEKEIENTEEVQNMVMDAMVRLLRTGEIRG